MKYSLPGLRKPCALLVLSLFFTGSAFAQIEDGLKNIQAGQFAKVKESSTRQIRKDPAGAHYVLAQLYATVNDKNTFYNLDSAYYHATLAEDNFAVYEQEKREKLISQGLNFSKVLQQKQTILDKAFADAQKQNTVEAYDHFITFFPESKDVLQATKLRNTAAYVLTQAVNTPLAYKVYMEKYPAAAEARDARKLYSVALFDSVNKIGTPEAYQNFIDNYSESLLRSQAEDSIYTHLTRNQTPEEYHNLIVKYPKNRNIAKAWSNIYRMYTYDMMPATYLSFLQKYPDYPKANEVKAAIRQLNKVLYPARIYDKWGFVNELGASVIISNFDAVRGFSENFAAVQQKGDWGYISKSGSILITPQFEAAGDFYSGLAPARAKGKYGLISKRGVFTTPPTYDSISLAALPYRIMEANGKYGYIDSTGKGITAPEYDRAFNFSEGAGRVLKDGKFGFVDRSGTLVVPCEYDSAADFHHNVALVKKGGKYGLIDNTNSKKLNTEYDRLYPVAEGKLAIVKGKTFGYARVDGKLVSAASYPLTPADTELYFSYGLAPIRVGAKAGLIDSSGKVVLQPTYEALKVVDLKHLAFQKDGKWGVMERTGGRIVSTVDYDYIGKLKGKFLQVGRGDKIGYLDSLYRETIPTTFDAGADFSSAGFCTVKRDGKEGIVNARGELVLPLEADAVEVLTPTLLKITRADKFAYFTLDGEKPRYIWKENGF